MGGSESREVTIERWCNNPKNLTCLLGRSGGLNSYLSTGMFQLAISNLQPGSDSLLLQLSRAVGSYPACFILSFFPAFVMKQIKEGFEYLECFVVLDQISILISCRTAVATGCCGGVDKNFDLRISLQNIENVTFADNILTIQYTTPGAVGSLNIQLRLPTNNDCLNKLKHAHAALHQERPTQWVYENVLHKLPNKDTQDKGLSKLFLAHLFTGESTDVTLLCPPVEWFATLPPLQHVYPNYYAAENKPSIPPPPLRELTQALPHPLPEFATLCLCPPSPRTYWSDIPFTERIKFGFPTNYLSPVVEAVTGTLLSNHSTIGDPHEINILKLHGSAYCQSHQIHLPSPRSNVNRPGYYVTPENLIASGGLLFGSTSRSNPLPCNFKIVSALLEALKYNTWCQVLEFGDCYIPKEHEERILPFIRDVCRYNTALISLSFPPRSPNSTPIQTNSPLFKLWGQIGEAMSLNPHPLFTSLDFSNCHLGDEGIRALLVGFKQLFSTLRKTLTSLKFTNNNLTGVGVTLICDTLLAAGNANTPFSHLIELSFGGNPWCGGGGGAGAGGGVGSIPIPQLNQIIALSPILRKLNLESTNGIFPIHLLKDTLIRTSCPLSDLSLGGCQLQQALAYEFVRSVIDIGNAKVNTLRAVSLRSIELDAAGAIEIINSLGSVQLDWSDKGLGQAYQVFISPHSRVVGLNCSRNPSFPLHWWTSFPPFLRDLNLSSLELINHPDLFQVLTTSLASSNYPLALQSVNIANLLTSPSSIIRFLEVCLLCPMIQLKKLDVTGCRLGDLLFHCLGHCLRKNRTLTTLKMDGQGATVVGWADFRGCLYGNKKLVDVSYPYCDAARFFENADKIIFEGYAAIPSFKSKIKQGYRQRDYAWARRTIDEMVAVKIKYKEWERAIGRTACVLQEIFTSVENNSKQAAVTQQQKKLLKLQTLKVFELKQKICVKEGKLLYQLVRGLEKQRNKTTDWNSSQWIEVDQMIRMTAYLFIPRNFIRFVTVLGYVFPSLFPVEITPSLEKMRVYIDDLEVKARTVWEQSMYELASEIKGMASGALAEFKGYQYTPPVKPPKAEKKKRDEEAEEEDRGYNDPYYYPDDTMNDHDYGDDNNDDRHERRRDRDRKRDEEKEKEKDKEKEKEDGDGDGNENDEEEEDPVEDVNNDNDNDNANDADLNNGLENVEMYGGAGPQDLPDGGPDDDPGSTAARCTFENIMMKKDPPRSKSSQFTSQLNDILAKCPTLFLPLEYEIKLSHAVISSSSASSSHHHSLCSLVTQCSVDRFPQLKSQILAWNSPVSVAIYIPSKLHQSHINQVNAFIDDLKDTLHTTGGSYFVVISLLFGHDCDSMKQFWDMTCVDETPVAPLYPVNNLRNLAVITEKTMIQSSLLFLVDVDFISSPGLSAWIDNSIVSRCDAGEMFVIPAFERDSDYLLDANQMKESVQEGLECGFITPFHVSHFPAGHQPTDFSRWLHSFNSTAAEGGGGGRGVKEEKGTDDTYAVPYQEYYEPYVIISNKNFQPYDERFRGYGMNKCIQVKAMHSAGGSFHVVHGHYLIAAAHERSQSHQLTYTPKSRLRRFIVAKLFQMASNEMVTSPPPSQITSLSKLTIQLLSERKNTAPCSSTTSTPPSMFFMKGSASTSPQAERVLLTLKRFFSSLKQKVSSTATATATSTAAAQDTHKAVKISETSCSVEILTF